MKLELYKNLYLRYAEKLGLNTSYSDLKEIDSFIPFIKSIKKDKSTVIIKIDGERESDIYTLVASGEALGEEEAIRIDTDDLEGGLAYICVEYAKSAWGFDSSKER